MAKISIVATKSERPEPIPVGVYQSKLKSIEEKTGDFGEYLIFSFEVCEGKHKGAVKNAVCSKKLSIPAGKAKGSKLYNLWVDVCGSDIKEGETFPFDDLVGLKFNVLVSNDRVDADGYQFQKVEKILPEEK